MENKDLKGLPDADLNAVMKDIQQIQDKDTKKDDDQTLDLAQFKNPKELLKSYKEVQGAFTRMSQENKTLKEQIAQVNERIELMGYQQPPTQDQINRTQVPSQIYDQDDEPVEQKFERLYTTRMIAEVLEEEAEKNKPEFQERYAFAQRVSNEYPHLTRSSKGVRKLFERGDKLRSESLKKYAGKALESIFGEPLNDEEIGRLRTMVKGDKTVQTLKQQTSNAYMPDTSTSTKTGADQDRKPNFDRQINESVEKGDVDGVIDATFKRILAE